MGNIRSEPIGQRLIDVLNRAWMNPPMTKSDFVREYADEIAAASSMGLITTKKFEAVYGRIWLITVSGLEFLNG